MIFEALDLTDADRTTLRQQFFSIVDFNCHPRPSRDLYYCLIYGVPVTTRALQMSFDELWRNA